THFPPRSAATACMSSRVLGVMPAQVGHHFPPLTTLSAFAVHWCPSAHSQRNGALTCSKSGERHCPPLAVAKACISARVCLSLVAHRTFLAQRSHQVPP